MAETEGMKGREILYIPDRLIADPVVFRGMTDSEIVGLMMVGTLFWTPISILILLPFGYGLFGVAIGVDIDIGTLLLASKVLIRLKRKQPDGLHVVHFKKMLQRKGLKHYGYIDQSQCWDIRRSKPVVRRPVATNDGEE